ncbi:MAG TPA: FAD-dependent oxidoreductase [Kiritimatiellia bacterium]|nr:FAD-dependent oxidoreductase [Kiritimatiellia bacterium]
MNDSSASSPASAPFRVAIVGAGPAGFFTAEELLKAKRPVTVDLFERLPHPYGLVRYGVAPDHPHTRRVTALMARTAANPACTLRFGVEVGRDITIGQLREQFDAVVIATGAEADRRLGIPGENLPGVHSSLAFAGWINGHPDFADEPFSFETETAVIIGNGNVALDIVRLLAKDPAALRETDIAPAALAKLARSSLRRIHVIGRRGPVQAAFGENEILEIGTLPGVNLRVDPVVAMPGAADEAELADPAADRARAVVKTLREYASRPSSPDARITVSFDFLRRPLGLSGNGRVEEITLELERLEGKPGGQNAVPTGALQTLRCGLVISSIGHRGVPLPGLPFDEERGVIPADGHRVAPGIYAVGWIKRGARGLIGHNRRDAMETVKAIWADHPN